MKFFDLHCDTLTKCMDNNKQLMQNDMQNSLSALLEYESPCQLFAIYTNDENVNNAYDYAKRAVDYFYIQKQKYSDALTLFSDVPDKNKVNAILTIEGGEPIESIEALQEFCDLGIKLITLTWNRVNKLGSGMMSGSLAGLTEFGKKVVREMNKKNIVADVSHLNIDGFKDVCTLAERPFAATHSNCFEICPHPRNLQDWQIKEIVDCGGIIGLNMYPEFLAKDEVSNIDTLIKHVDHFLKLGCENTLCLGCDFDGIDIAPHGINGTTDMKNVYTVFKKCFGDVADKIFYENAFAFWKYK